jgi:putative flippase GtrA
VVCGANYGFAGRAPAVAFAILNDSYAESAEEAPKFAVRMRQIHQKAKKQIFSVLDFFYPLFRRFMPLQTYHYAACGGSNTLLSLCIYTFSHNILFNKQVVHLGPLAFESYVAALGVAFFFTLPIGFYLSMYITFQGSYLRRRVQFIRYFLVAVGCVLINYVILKLLVEVIGLYPTPAQLITTVVVILFSYFSQRHFSFRTHKARSEEAGELRA